MENITLGQIGTAVAFVTALVGGIILLVKWIRSVIVKVMRTELEPLKAQIETIDLENCKNYLVTYLADAEKGNYKDKIEEERFWEELDHYQKIGGNSYIKTKVDQLQAAGKI
ncbi:MAG: hypothetical protein IKF99_01200 [Oscillospiraceae bacterium]|nr:hypothetical protein [Oscillospiraceae bacterium]